MLPEKHFDSREELVKSYMEALKEANLMKLLQTMDPIVIDKIKGNERTFMLFLRSQPNPVDFILNTRGGFDHGNPCKAPSLMGR